MLFCMQESYTVFRIQNIQKQIKKDESFILFSAETRDSWKAPWLSDKTNL